MEFYVEQWSQLWKSADTQCKSVMDEVTFELTPTHDEATIISSSNKFRTRTCQRDGWHPRHYGLLGPTCLEAMVQILTLSILASKAPERTSALEILLSPKVKGEGRRPIGFQYGFPAGHGQTPCIVMPPMGK